MNYYDNPMNKEQVFKGRLLSQTWPSLTSLGGRGGDFTKKSQACISLTERVNILQVLRFNPTVWDNEHHWVLTEINSLVWLEGLLGDVIRSKMSARLGVVWPLLALESHNEGKHFQNNNRITLQPSLNIITAPSTMLSEGVLCIWYQSDMPDHEVSTSRNTLPTLIISYKVTKF